MPKEVIYSDDGPYLMVPGEGEYPEGSPESLAAAGRGEWQQRGIVIRWSKEGFVEIGASSFDIAEGEVRDGTFMTLDRAGLNRLISMVRRARSQAYGKDQ